MQLGELSTRTEPLQEEQEARDGERRLREAAERRRLDGERQEAEERGRRELCAREEEWRRATEEERKAHAAQVQKQAEREALLDSEVSEPAHKVQTRLPVVYKSSLLICL